MAVHGGRGHNGPALTGIGLTLIRAGFPVCLYGGGGLNQPTGLFELLWPQFPLNQYKHGLKKTWHLCTPTETLKRILGYVVLP